MARGYGQYCPLALAAELLAERWTILVVSRLIDGCSTFNEIHRGVPKISPALLSKRLVELEQAGILTKARKRAPARITYKLTPAGHDLAPIIDQMAVWGQHWARDLAHDDLDPAFLAWSMHTRFNQEAMPSHRVVVEFEFSGVPKGYQRFWIVSDKAKIDMCLKNPGYDVDVHVRADIARFIQAWRGFRNLRSEIRTGRIRVTGPKALTRQFPNWLLLSSLAPYERKRKGAERRLRARATSGG